MILDGIPSDVTPWSIVGLIVLLVLTGRLVPRVNLRDKTREADQWREAYEKEHEARAISDRQTAELLEVTKTTNSIIVATFGQNGVVRQSGGPDATPKA